MPVVRLSYPDLKVVNLIKKAFSITKQLIPGTISINQLKDNKIDDLLKPFKSFLINGEIEEILIPVIDVIWSSPVI